MGRVKKNRSAYNLFIKDRFAKRFHSKFRKCSTKEAMASLTKEWRELPYQDRRLFELKAKEEKDAYLRYKKTKVARERKQKDRLMPKRPIAPYTLFQIEERQLHPDQYQHLSLEMAAKQIALKWRLLDSNQKNKYVKLFKSQNKAYEKAKRNLKLQQIRGEKVKGQKKKVHQPFVAFIKDHIS